MKLPNVCLVFLLLLSATMVGSTATFFPATRGEFEARVGNVSITTFDGLVGTAQYPSNYPGGGGWYGGTVTIEGTSFQTGFLDRFHILNHQVETNRFTIDGYTLSGGRITNQVIFPSGIGGFCADLDFDRFWFRHPGTDIWSDTVTAKVRFADGGVEDRTFPVSGRTFFGVVGREIREIDFGSGGPNALGLYTPYLMFDNVSIKRLPDIKAWSISRRSDNDIEFRFLITNGPASMNLFHAIAGLYWANGTTAGNLVSSIPIFEYPIPPVLSELDHTVPVPSSNFANPPPDSTHVVLIIDRLDVVPESNEGNNVAAIKYPWLRVVRSGNFLEVSWNDPTMVPLEADSLSGPWTPAFQGQSSPVVVSPISSRKFYRGLKSSN